MNELYFMAMDIVEELKSMMNFTIATVTEGMTESEFAAYNSGVKNTISALQALLEDDFPVINICNMEVPTELTVDELEEYYESL